MKAMHNNTFAWTYLGHFETHPPASPRQRKQQDSCNKPSSGCLKDCESRHRFPQETIRGKGAQNAASLPPAPFPGGFSLVLLNCFPKPPESSSIIFPPFLFLRAHSWIGKH